MSQAADAVTAFPILLRNLSRSELRQLLQKVPLGTNPLRPGAKISKAPVAEIARMRDLISEGAIRSDKANVPFTQAEG